MKLAISIVLYAPDMDVLHNVLQSLEQAVGYAKKCHELTVATLYLVDNGPADTITAQQLQRYLQGEYIDNVELLTGHGNVGYAKGHNLAMVNDQTNSDFFLVLNPDVIIAENSLYHALQFLTENAQAGLLVPAVQNSKGERQYLCKRYPSVFNFLLRGFAPDIVKKLFNKRLADYEMRDVIADTVVWDVPIVSGCFMLFRYSLLKQLNGFSAAFFLYFEDFDLSLRVAEVNRIVYVPTVRIIHFGGEAAKKGWQHISFFLRSGIIFFNRHGWKWF